MHERTIYSHTPLASLDACCEKHQHIPSADRAVASMSFVVEEHEHDEGATVREQKFALMILADGATMDRGGIEITPRITMLILDNFAELVSDMVGPQMMAAAMVQAVIRKYGAEVLEEETTVEIAGTPENPMLGGRRRGDYRH